MRSLTCICIMAVAASLMVLMSARLMTHPATTLLLTRTERCLPLQGSPLLHPQAFKRVNYSSISPSKSMATQHQGTGNIVVYVTVPNKDAGKELANSIINARLAACVNQVPGIESTYLWQGKVETDSEVLLIIKTRESLLQALTQHVVENHKYEVPEVIALPIIGGNPSYIKWLEDSTKAD